MGNSPECCFEDKLLEHTRAGDVRHQRSQQTRFLFLHDGSPPIPQKNRSPSYARVLPTSQLFSLSDYKQMLCYS